MSSYSTLKPEMVSEAETQEMTKLLEVISVTDSEMSIIGGGGVISPCDVATTKEGKKIAIILFYQKNEVLQGSRIFPDLGLQYRSIFCTTDSVKYKQEKQRPCSIERHNCIQKKMKNQ